jgi:hypothetical protein
MANYRPETETPAWQPVRGGKMGPGCVPLSIGAA